MTTKTYKSPYQLYTTFLLVNGRIQRIQFSDMSADYSTYTTSNESVQKALESNSDFGRYYTLYKTQDEPKHSETEPIPLHLYEKEFPDVRKVNEAVDILVNSYGIERSSLNSSADVRRAASQININFPNLGKRG